MRRPIDKASEPIRIPERALVRSRSRPVPDKNEIIEARNKLQNAIAIKPSTPMKVAKIISFSCFICSEDRRIERRGSNNFW